MATSAAFEEAYKRLNSEQKRAVDAVEGPVMVIAGPGTGKTYVLTLRIANILKETPGTTPENILVLTFTDSAARTVARRLGMLIGEESARKVGIYTFHSFAECVMKRYPEAFPEYTDRRLMGEVEQILLWRSILESRKDSRLRTPKSPYHYLNDIKSLEDKLTRERLSLADYRAWLDTEAQHIEEDPDLHYKRGGKGGVAGELNPLGVKRLERLEKGDEAIELIEAYRSEKDARHLYGYTDVLRIAVDALTSDEALRADLQEQYQYVLADEHQDANALQHALLDALAFDDHPNLFIVGDEKQAVFGFQGADATHFETFLKLYPRTSIIALTENYRSYQDILDHAHMLLGELPSSTGGHIQLTAARGKGGSAYLLTAPDLLAERDQVATLVEEAISSGVAPHEIAVITLKNKTADLFALHLVARGVPVLRAGDIDLEGRPAIRYLLALMRTVADPLDIAALREALLAPWWPMPLAERARLLRRARDSELEEALTSSFPNVAETLMVLRGEAIEVPPLSLFSHLLKESGARDYFLLGAERIAEDIPLVRTLIMHIEDLVRRDPNATFAEVVESFEKAREHEVSGIKTSLTQEEGKVTVITAHKAKGMEFERVFVTALTASEWEGRGKNALLPSPFDTPREKAEITRLLYVAMTRAKNILVLSYAANASEGKEQTPMSLLPETLTPLEVSANPLPLMHVATEAPALVRELTLRYLAHDGLSPSAYNEYLESPPTFFARRVLRLREPETRAIVVGNAVHAGVATWLSAVKEFPEARAEAARAELARKIRLSLLPRGDTFDALERHAHALLETALINPALAAESVSIEETFSVLREVFGERILLKGKIDAVLKENGDECIVDFKTSTQIEKKDKEKFERQIAFYDLLLRANDHAPIAGRILQLTEDDLKEHEVALTDETRTALAASLNDVLLELVTGHWRSGAPSDYDALLGLFTSNTSLLQAHPSPALG